jgi:hypothetical protein
MASETPQPLSFADFLEKMKDPAAADLVRNIKRWLLWLKLRPNTRSRLQD